MHGKDTRTTTVFFNLYETFIILLQHSYTETRAQLLRNYCTYNTWFFEYIRFTFDLDKLARKILEAHRHREHALDFMVSIF